MKLDTICLATTLANHVLPKDVSYAILVQFAKYVPWDTILQHLILVPFAISIVTLAMLVVVIVQAAFQVTISQELPALPVVITAKHVMEQLAFLVIWVIIFLLAVAQHVKEPSTAVSIVLIQLTAMNAK